MKETKIVLTIFFVLLASSVAGTMFVNTVSAQFGPAMNMGPDYTPLSIEVVCPIENQVYSSNSAINLTIIITKPASWFTYEPGTPIYQYDCQGEVNFIRYRIDGESIVTIPANDNYSGLFNDPIPTNLTYTLPLQRLSQGLHTISFSVEGVYHYWTSIYTSNPVVGNSSEIQFYVGTSPTPTLSPLALGLCSETTAITAIIVAAVIAVIIAVPSYRRQKKNKRLQPDDKTKVT